MTAQQLPRIINDRYVIHAQPKRGGMADVYRAMDLSGDSEVAVKVFRFDVLSDALIAEAFRRETEAMKNCSHPNILRLLDSGIEPNSKRHYLVFEWMPDSLDELLKRESFRDWDQFYTSLGRPILDALALAHARQVIHRDIKPSNILLDSNGVPKLSDFSIAKLKTWHDEGYTLNQFATQLYSAPEHTIESSYSQDLFSYAVLAVRCLTNGMLEDLQGVQEALRSAPVPDEIRSELALCLSEPHERPVLGGLLLSSIDAIAEKRRHREKLRTSVHLVASGKVTQRVRTSLGILSNEVEQAILNDLKEMPALGTGQGSAQMMELYGGEFVYRVSLGRSSGDYLMLEDAYNHPAASLEFRRNKAFPLHCSWSFGKPRLSLQAASTLNELLIQFQNHQAEMRLAEATARENELFDMWARTLRAKAQVESEKQPAIGFRGFEVDGSRIVFDLLEPVRDIVAGFPRHVRNRGRTVIRGEVELSSGTRLVLRVQDMDPDLKSFTGILAYDASLATIALERQMGALNAVRYQRCVRPELRNFLVFPGEVRPPDAPSTSRTFFRENLSPDKKAAVIAALGTPDVLLVEGPPGTGKTTFITEVILQTLEENPSARILLTSQTHVALDHVIGAVQKTGRDVSTVRIGRLGDVRISRVAEGFLLENKMEEWRKEALESGRQYLQQRAELAGVSLATVNMILQLRRLMEERNRSFELRDSIAELETKLASLSSIEAELTAEERRSRTEEAKLLRDQVDVDRMSLERSKRVVLQMRQEAVAAGVPEPLLSVKEPDIERWANEKIPATPQSNLLRRLVDLHAKWEMQCGRTADFQEPILSSVQLVAGTCVGIDSSRGTRDVQFDLCIIDEASKAASTELLVPMAKARRWIIVGDDRQLPPFVDDRLIVPKLLDTYDLDEKALRDTLFTHLKNGLPDKSHVELYTQHRMTPAIGELVSHCFYDDKLKSEERGWDSRLSPVLPKPVVWITTSKLSNREETRHAPSFSNPAEVRVITELIDSLEERAANANATYSVGVLSGYVAQKEALERALASRMGPDRHLKIECNTVDAFQGREVDIVVYSITRSNPKHQLGFLGEMRRLNVALSRGREYLVIVGDHYFCQVADEPNPVRPVIAFVQSHPESCLLIEETT